MKTITKTDTRIERTSYGALALVMGSVFALVGGYFTLAGLRVIPLPGKANAPLWVIAAVGVAFASAGLLLFVQALRGLGHRRRSERMRVQEPARPWLADYPWRTTGVGDPVLERWIKQLVGMVIVAAIIAPLNWWGFLSRDGNLAIQIFAGLLDLAWIGLSLVVVYRALQIVKYGQSRLSFAHFPFSPGETLTVRFSPNRFKRIEATLRFVEERFETTGTRSNRSSVHRVYEHWSQRQVVSADLGESEVPISFELPDDLDLVTRLTADPAVRYWELVVEADQPGIDFRTTFPLPVYNRSGPPLINPPELSRSPLDGLRRVPYAFELGLPAVLLGAVAALWMVAPQSLLGAVEVARDAALRVQARFMLEAIDGVGTSALAVEAGPDHRVWALTKYSVDRFTGGVRTNLLDTASYRAAFDHKVNALSSLLVTGEDEAWVGSWYGEVFHYLDGQWSEVSRRDDPLSGRIHDLAWFDERLYLATREGLWQLGPEGLGPVVGLPAGEVESVAEDGGAACAGVESSLWCLAGGSWSERWTASEDITSLSPAIGGWYVGSRDGLWLVADSGSTEQLVAGFDVRAVVEHDGRLWVASWDGGVLVLGDQWSRLEMESLAGLALDGEERVWLASYGGGLISIPRASLEKLLRELDPA